jgi:NADH-quinone oxidoreductase subunit E
MPKLEKMDVGSEKIDKVIKKYRNKPGELLSILEEIQSANEHKYLSEEVLSYVGKKVNIPLAQIYSVATFYTFFNLKPQGDHSIIVCRGTACHTRRSKNILEYIKKLLDLKEDASKEGEKLFLTTKDNKFTLRTVACFGQCALAPVVEVDGKIYGSMTEEKIKNIIKKVGSKAKSK